MSHRVIIGLEVHVELKTKRKMFCECLADYFGQKPNTHTCPVCLGLPGALPVTNKKAIEWCTQIGLSLNCNIPLFSKFDRKNYFYPDLPKGYQISQYDEPFCLNGDIEVNEKKIRITRVHMEEDTGKLLHETVDGQNFSLIDFNRSGVPLVEIVTEPDFDNAKDVKAYLQKLQQIVRYLGVSDADMEKGQMRLEPNISVSLNPDSKDLPKYKVEVKNINSFSFVEKAINFEIERQLELLQKGQTPLQETRGWDENKQKTVSQRVKEEANDYRYFPEPDIPPIRWKESEIDKLKESLPELPDKKIQRFIVQYHLPFNSAATIARDQSFSDFFESTATIGQQNFGTASEVTANVLINKKLPYGYMSIPDAAQEIANLSKIEEVSENELRKIIKEVLAKNPKISEDYKKGNENVLQFAIGQVMYILRKKIDTKILRDLILEELK